MIDLLFGLIVVDCLVLVFAICVIWNGFLVDLRLKCLEKRTGM